MTETRSTTVAMHVGQLLQPLPGGIGRYIRELARALPNEGVGLTTFAAGTVSGLDVPHTNLGFPGVPWRYELWHRLRRPRVHVDAKVVHAPSLAIPPTDVPLVVTIHDIASVRFPHLFTERGVHFHERGLELARAHAAAIIVPSTFTRDELVREQFDAERIHVIPHGAPPLLDAAGAGTLLGFDTPFVLTVGTVEPRKGIATVVDAVRAARAKVPELRLVVAGPRGWGDHIDLDEPWISELGPVDDARLGALYDAATLVTVASRYEGFGLPALEAMAHGAPVLVADATSLPEVVGDAGVLLPVDDADAWSEAMVDVVTSRDRREHLRAAGRARAATFSWDRSAAAHAAVFAESARLPR